MRKQYFQSQYILNKVFENESKDLRMTLNTSQDYLNAVFDNSKNALRVKIDGAGGFPKPVETLPESGEQGEICWTFSEDKKFLEFYQWNNGEWEYKGSTGIDGSTLTPEQEVAVEWVTENLDKLKEVVDFNYIVNLEDINLIPGTTEIEVQGKVQNIDDDLDGDDDDTTPYRIDITGYVMSVSTFATADSPVPDRYYTRITYDSAGGGLGVSHVYMNQDEYEFFSNLPNGKNVLRAYCITNATTSPIKRARYTINADGTVVDLDGVVYSAIDESNTDGDAETTYCIDCAGYALGVQTYASNEAKIMDKCYVKIVYESDGIHAGRSKIYLLSEDYQRFAQLSNGKNILDIYYVGTVFPASVTISETQYKIPSDSPEYVVVDASGAIHNISDVGDVDGDAATCVRIPVNGYVLDIDGYYQSTDKAKKRLYAKVAYSPEFDVSDIYLDNEAYDHIASLENGKNVISIYTLGAGIGVDASRIQQVDSALDVTSERAIQNKVVKGAVDALMQEIEALKQRIETLEGN